MQGLGACALPPKASGGRVEILCYVESDLHKASSANSLGLEAVVAAVRHDSRHIALLLSNTERYRQATAKKVACFFYLGCSECAVCRRLGGRNQASLPIHTPPLE